LKPRPRRHRDEKLVTITPLEFVLTNCDARNLFRFRSYKNCRVSLGSTYPFLKFHFNFSLLSPFITRHSPFFSSFPFMRLRTLSFSVSRKSCICHSYENTGGVPELFPVWNARLAIISLVRVSDPYRPSVFGPFLQHSNLQLSNSLSSLSTFNFQPSTASRLLLTSQRAPVDN
jgi:hypothetical protein